LWLPIAAALGRWGPRPQARRPVLAALWYVGCAVAVAILHTALVVALYFPLSPAGLAAMLRHRPYALLPDLLAGVTVCGLILGLALARAGEVRASQLEAQLAQAQLEALRMQLHPHFLFNTLNAIGSLEMEERARRMLVRVSDFLRLTLQDAGVQRVTLAREVEFLAQYLEIERTRFADRLTVEIAVDAEAREAMVPNLILQPIVENAVRHGISARAAAGTVGVYASRSNGSLVLRVRDSGPGLHGSVRTGRGLAITRSRLDGLYGGNARLAMENGAAGGFEVRIELPFERGDQCAS